MAVQTRSSAGFQALSGDIVMTVVALQANRGLALPQTTPSAQVSYYPAAWSCRCLLRS